MDDSSGKFDVETLLSYADDLVKVLKEKRDVNSLTQCLEQSNSLSSSCNADSNEIRSILEDYQKKLDKCKEKTDQARSEIAADAELDLLQGELEEELEKQRLLNEELRACRNEFNDLEQKILSIQVQKKNLKKIEKAEQRAELLLSMYASVTNIIPILDDQYSKISGCILLLNIVEKDKNAFEKFEFDSSKITAFDACNGIWKIAGSQ